MNPPPDNDDAGATLRATGPRVIAVIGNPNTGKSTLFNALTGVRQRTGNYPGVTVERRHGMCRIERDGREVELELIDLPGTYSLAARSEDEIVAVDVLCGRSTGPKPEAVLLVLDATNLERNLYLASQVLELGLPVVVALSMVDLAAARGVAFEASALAATLGVPCIAINALKGTGLEALLAALDDTRTVAPLPELAYPKVLSDAVGELAGELSAVLVARGEGDAGVSRAEALRLLADRGARGLSRLSARIGASADERIQAKRQHVLATLGKAPSVLEAIARADWARAGATRVLPRVAPVQTTQLDGLDRVLTHKWWGSLIFLGLMALVFQAIFTWAEPLMAAIEDAFGALGSLVEATIEPGWFQSLLVRGIIEGVGGVLVFLPQILILFVVIAFLEGTGYLSRAAYLMDRWLRKFGLSGHSFIPLASGFACAVPALMSTRNIPDRASRLTTLIVTPLMSCSARLPVYVLLIGAFVPDRPIFGPMDWRGVALLGSYLIGVVVAVAAALLLRRTAFKGESPHLMLELPTYRMPRMLDVFRQAGEKGWAFVKTAGSIIFATSLVVWAATYFPRPTDIVDRYAAQESALLATPASDEREAALVALAGERDAELMRESALGQAARVLEPVFLPLGWDWRIGSSVIASFPAREVVIASMGILFGQGGEVDEESGELKHALQKATFPDGRPLFTLATALSIIVFFALCMQCAATLATIKRETNSWRWPVLVFVGMTVLAWLAACATYQFTAAVGG